MAVSSSMISAVDRAEAGFAADREEIESRLSAACADALRQVRAPVDAAIRYTLEGGGKRLRGLLLLASYRAASGNGNAAGLAAAVEVVHAYSLVHDDLPCMDNDDVRRGRPTVHRAFGVPAAIAAGVTMVPFATLLACDAARELRLPRSVAGDIVTELMRASGAGGMIGGQLLDLEGEGKDLNLADLERIHRAKTGALIEAAVRIGALAAGAGAPRMRALEEYGSNVGLAFQIADDILDVTSTTDQLGKTAGRDAALRKSTYPSVMGVERAAARAASLVNDACAALEPAGLRTPALEALARFVVERRS